jgi:polyhydroxybutyrate depolymerase
MPLRSGSSGSLPFLAALALCAACGGSEASPPSDGGSAAGEAAPPSSDGNTSPGAAPDNAAPEAPVSSAPEGLPAIRGVDQPAEPSSGEPGSTLEPAPSAGCGNPAGLASGRASIDVAGTAREYILHVPESYDPNRPYRLIFGWHPWGGSAEQIESRGYFGIRDVSDEQAILVAPEGEDFRGNGLGWGNEGGRDLAFLHSMLERFSSQLCIDESRIFSTGFSFGAMFSFTLACSSEGRMRAIAPQAGNATTSGPCEDGTRSVATLAFVGTEDTLLEGHRRAVDILVERNGCSSPAAPLQASWCDGLGAEDQPCSCVEYPGCKAGYPVIACEYEAGHQFAPNAGQTLWEFFSQF